MQHRRSYESLTLLFCKHLKVIDVGMGIGDCVLQGNNGRARYRSFVSNGLKHQGPLISGASLRCRL